MQSHTSTETQWQWNVVTLRRFKEYFKDMMQSLLPVTFDKFVICHWKVTSVTASDSNSNNQLVNKCQCPSTWQTLLLSVSKQSGLLNLMNWLTCQCNKRLVFPYTQRSATYCVGNKYVSASDSMLHNLLRASWPSLSCYSFFRSNHRISSSDV
jgi:hypothetical protein